MVKIPTTVQLSIQQKSGAIQLESAQWAQDETLMETGCNILHKSQTTDWVPNQVY